MMAEEQGAPRKTTTYNKFSGMNSQDGRYGVEPDEFFYLENIMRIADGRLHSVPGPGAVVFTVGGEFLLLEDGFFILLEDGGRIRLEP